MMVNDIEKFMDINTMSVEEQIEAIKTGGGATLSDGSPVRESLLRKALKIRALRSLDRLTPEEFEFEYDLALNESGVILDLNAPSISRSKYLYLVRPDGQLREISIPQYGSSLPTISLVGKSSTKEGAHPCTYLRGASHIFGGKRAPQIYEHILVAIVTGLYDGRSLEDLYTLHVNHRNGEDDNDPLNLELCTPWENRVHGIVLGHLKSLGWRGYLNARDAVEIYNGQKKIDSISFC